MTYTKNTKHVLKKYRKPTSNFVYVHINSKRQ